MNVLHRSMSCKIRFSLEKSLLSYSWINFQIQTAWFYSCPSNTLIIAFSAFYHLTEKISTLPVTPQTVSPPSCLRTFQELEWFHSRLKWNGEMRKRKKNSPWTNAWLIKEFWAAHLQSFTRVPEILQHIWPSVRGFHSSRQLLTNSLSASNLNDAKYSNIITAFHYDLFVFR